MWSGTVIQLSEDTDHTPALITLCNPFYNLRLLYCIYFPSFNKCLRTVFMLIIHSDRPNLPTYSAIFCTQVPTATKTTTTVQRIATRSAPCVCGADASWRRAAHSALLIAHVCVCVCCVVFLPNVLAATHIRSHINDGRHDTTPDVCDVVMFVLLALHCPLNTPTTVFLCDANSPQLKKQH